MIRIGLTGWGDHDDLYPHGLAASDKLNEYSKHFSIVEVDSSFYAVQPTRNYQKWIRDTPESFQFIVKAYQGMTGHLRGKSPFIDQREMFSAFKESIHPLVEAGRLAMVLCQFPPWFDCKKENVAKLRDCKTRLEGLPVALEFRHQSWFTPSFKEQTLDFMKEEQWIHSICDEPQAGLGSVPTVLEPTDSDKTLIRFHGRNDKGWVAPGDGSWRDVRYLYRYSKDELSEWVSHLEKLNEKTKEIYVLFNNNSGGDAAQNAKELERLLGHEPLPLAPRQISLFDDLN
ncbi:DUF72 domain-containing protein [Bacillus alkalicellulosilyticus]|uniref:DUF72 domain-containing protein n=1 Tax=Alkalihalobacterium alkalicellulosilyticum TaxID=1912214 RepID=UPI0009971D2A|nr:DUF72 domain-containing protein [Bacillus alkalicellulosilyticus]